MGSVSAAEVGLLLQLPLQRRPRRAGLGQEWTRTTVSSHTHELTAQRGEASIRQKQIKADTQIVELTGSCQFSIATDRLTSRQVDQ